MKTTFIAAVLVAILTVLPNASSSQQVDGLTTCDGRFALCAASTCTPTGRTIATTMGETYPEVECRCPILEGKALADTQAGNMTGSCDIPRPGTVWSLFAPRVFYPQEASGFSLRPQDMRARVQMCGADLNQGYNASNCFSFICDDLGNGTASCRCPMGQVPANTAFLTEAGQGDPQACMQHPVSLPLGVLRQYQRR
jgi:hypothetical protein